MEKASLFTKRIGGPRSVLKALPALLLVCGLGMANAAIYAPDDFADNGGTNLETMVMVKDGSNRVVVGGLFNVVEGQTGYQGLARFLADDTLDTTFQVVTNEYVRAVAIQGDGKILIGGAFNYVTSNGAPTVTSSGIARLNEDGSVDASFHAVPLFRVNSPVRSIVVQPDGKILVGGYFTSFDGVSRTYMVRLNADGTQDNSFSVTLNNQVEDVKLLADGKILISGSFTTVNGTSRWGVARLNSNGTLDTTFVPNSTSPASINGAWGGLFPIYQMAVQSDGKVLYAGGTLNYAGEFHRGVARLNTNGTPDSSFKTLINDWGTSLALQTDGKILLGGSFTVVGQRDPANAATVIGTDVVRQGIARLNTDGSVDADFDTSSGTNALVWAILPNADGTVYLGGKFTNVAGVARRGIARLAPVDPTTTQVITFPAPNPAVYSAMNGATVSWTAAATSSQGLPVTYSSLTPSICSVNATTGQITLPPTAVTGECTIQADAAAGTANGNDYPAATPVQRSIQIDAPPDQSITFPAQASSANLGSTFNISPAATASSTLPVTYSSLTPDVCTVSGTTVTPVAEGECIIAADQPGGSVTVGGTAVNFDAAPQVTQSVVITAVPVAPAVAKPVPTLGTLGLGLLASLLGVMGFRRRRAQ